MRIDINSVDVRIKPAPISVYADIPYRALFTVISEGSKLIYMKIPRANDNSPNSVCMSGGMNDVRMYEGTEQIEYIGQVIVDAQRAGEVVQIPAKVESGIEFELGDTLLIQVGEGLDDTNQFEAVRQTMTTVTGRKDAYEETFNKEHIIRNVTRHP